MLHSCCILHAHQVNIRKSIRDRFRGNKNWFRFSCSVNQPDDHLHGINLFAMFCWMSPSALLKGAASPDFVHTLPKLVISFWGRINMWRKNSVFGIYPGPFPRVPWPLTWRRGTGPWPRGDPVLLALWALSNHKMLPVQEQLFLLAHLSTAFPCTPGLCRVSCSAETHSGLNLLTPWPLWGGCRNQEWEGCCGWILKQFCLKEKPKGFMKV